MSKVIVQFKATGSAPILKQPFYKLSAQQKFSTVMSFLRKLLQLQEGDPLVRFYKYNYLKSNYLYI